jgi:hypothetical protein
MDHITKLYQNRAKVLQEEVNRLEGLLEAVVAAPPIKMRQGVKNEADANAKEEAEAEAAAKAAADAEIKKIEKARKDIEERPILGRISKAHDDIVNGYYGLAADINKSPYFDIAKKLGVGAGIYGLLTPRWSINPENAGKMTSIFSDQAVDQLTGEPVKGIFKKKPELLGRGWLARSINDARNEKRLEKVAQQRTAAEAAEAARKAAEEAKLTRTQKTEIIKNAGNIKPGDIGPSGELLRDPNLQIGEKGSMLDAGRDLVRERVKSATETQSGVKGGRLTADAEKMLRTRQADVLKSIGTITPEDIEMAMQGAKDVAMTGREVAGKVGRAATRPLPGSSSALATGLVQGGVGLAGELAGEYLVKPAAEKIGLTDLLAKGISAVVPNSVLAAGNSPAEDERADEEISNNLRRMGIKSGRLTGPMGIDIGKK